MKRWAGNTHFIAMLGSKVGRGAEPLYRQPPADPQQRDCAKKQQWRGGPRHGIAYSSGKRCAVLSHSNGSPRRPRR